MKVGYFMPKGRGDMKFSAWNYTRSDYPEVKKKINDYKNKMQGAASYPVFRDAWLDVKKEIEYMVFLEEIIYIRHLCGIDYEHSLKEVEIQNREDPMVYALRDECDRMAAVSVYRAELEQEFGRQVFRPIDQQRAVNHPDSMRIKSEESALKSKGNRLLPPSGNRCQPDGADCRDFHNV